MIVLPAIDLKDGQVVRLYKGDFGTVHQVAADPAAVARDFLAAGPAGSMWWTWTGPGTGCGRTGSWSAPWLPWV